MANLVDLITNVMVSAPGVPEPLAIAKYRDAAREFFRRTNAWRLPGAAASAASGSTSEYEIAVPSGAEVFDISYARVGDDSPLIKQTFEQVQYKLGATASTTPRYFRVAAGRLVIHPDPGEDISDELVVDAILRPSRDATTLPDEQADEFGEIIEHGALGRLLSMPAKQWTDYEGASFYWKLFLSAIDEWSSRGADGGMKNVPRRVRYGGL